MLVLLELLFKSKLNSIGIGRFIETGCLSLTANYCGQVAVLVLVLHDGGVGLYGRTTRLRCLRPFILLLTLPHCGTFLLRQLLLILLLLTVHPLLLLDPLGPLPLVHLSVGLLEVVRVEGLRGQHRSVQV